MATIDTLSGAAGPLTRVTVPLGRHEFHDRQFYGLGDFMDWMTQTVPTLQPGVLNAPQTPAEQLDDILHKWIAGRPMRYGRWFRDLMPRADEVWELKSADLRIFGWLYRPRVFIAVFGDYADFYKGKNPRKHYDNARKRVVNARDQIDLNPPKFAMGVFDALV